MGFLSFEWPNNNTICSNCSFYFLKGQYFFWHEMMNDFTFDNSKQYKLACVCLCSLTGALFRSHDPYRIIFDCLQSVGNDLLLDVHHVILYWCLKHSSTNSKIMCTFLAEVCVYVCLLCVCACMSRCACGSECVRLHMWVHTCV